MMFVIGPAASGKRSYVATLGVDPRRIRVLDDIDDDAYVDADDEKIYTYRDDLVSRYEVLIGTEIGCGLVPVSASERRRREAVGRLHCLVAEAADVVVRMYCGIPHAIKGTLPLPGKTSCRGDDAA